MLVLHAKTKSGKSGEHRKRPTAIVPVALPEWRGAAQFAHGVHLFNSRKFFEAHEAWEEIWLHTPPPEKTFLQGLIQITAAFHHYSRKNHRGTKSLLRAGLEKVETFPANHGGLHLEQLRANVRRWLASLEHSRAHGKLTLPKIRLEQNEK